MVEIRCLLSFEPSFSFGQKHAKSSNAVKNYQSMFSHAVNVKDTTEGSIFFYCSSIFEGDFCTCE